MALPPFNSDTMSDSGNQPPGRNTTTRRTFAQVVAKTRESLMNKPTHHTSDGGGELQLTTRIWKTARTEGALFFDMTPLADKTQQYHMTLLKDQYPIDTIFAAIPKRDGKQPYLEVYPTSTADVQNIKDTGIVYNDVAKNTSIRILPCKSIPDATNIKKLSLSYLPMIEKEKVIAGLKQSLAPYGELLDAGILLEPQTQYFMGTGYALLDISATESGAATRTLTHKISWCNEEESFHATWAAMPTWCRYCHEEGHSKFVCEKSKASILCYSCKHFGHRSFECPRKNTELEQKKRKT
ncbi:hypothetical protein BCR42DRAFT_405453, partial [Absidia repens]